MKMGEVPLSEIAEVRLGRQRSPKNHSGPSNRQYLRAANVGWNGLKLDDVKVMNFTDAEMAVYRLEKGDLLLNEASGSPAEVGKPAVWMGELDDCAFQNTLLRVRPGPAVDHRYLLHYLRNQASSAAFARGSRGVGIHHLGREALAKWPVPLRPLEDQRRIAAILDYADGLRSKRRQVVVGLAELAQSIFAELFGDLDEAEGRWPTVSLGELMASGPQNGLYRPAADYGSGYTIVRIDAFRGGSPIDIATLKRVNVSETVAELYGLATKDVLVNRVNSIDHLGKATVVAGLDEPTIFESNMMRFTLNPSLAVPEFVVAFLGTSRGKGQIRTAAKDAVNQSSINQTDVKNFRVPLPPMPLQSAYLDRIKQISAMRSRYDCSVGEFNALFASLQSRAFRGEL